MRYKINTAAASTPITRAEAKSHAQVPHDLYDDDIDNYILAATEFAQKDTWRQFITATWDGRLDQFPAATKCNPEAAIWIPQPPLLTIESFTYVDSTGATVTLVENTDFTVDTFSDIGSVRPVYNGSWPTARGYRNDVSIQWTCGYGATNGDVPEDIRQAIRHLTAHFIDRRAVVSFVQGVVMEDIPYTYSSAIRDFRIRDERILPDD